MPLCPGFGTVRSAHRGRPGVERGVYFRPTAAQAALYLAVQIWSTV